MRPIKELKNEPIGKQVLLRTELGLHIGKVFDNGLEIDFQGEPVAFDHIVTEFLRPCLDYYRASDLDSIDLNGEKQVEASAREKQHCDDHYKAGFRAGQNAVAKKELECELEDTEAFLHSAVKERDELRKRYDALGEQIGVGPEIRIHLFKNSNSECFWMCGDSLAELKNNLKDALTITPTKTKAELHLEEAQRNLKNAQAEVDAAYEELDVVLRAERRGKECGE